MPLQPSTVYSKEKHDMNTPGSSSQVQLRLTILIATKEYPKARVIWSLDTAIAGSSKDVLYFTLCVFSALQS